jgi:hypothetical protein
MAMWTRGRSGAENHRYAMRTISFHVWLEHRLEEVPDAGNLALLIAQSGAAGVSLDRLRSVVRVSPDTLNELLRALVSAGQVAIAKVHGRLVYRAAM